MFKDTKKTSDAGSQRWGLIEKEGMHRWFQREMINLAFYDRRGGGKEVEEEKTRECSQRIAAKKD